MSNAPLWPPFPLLTTPPPYAPPSPRPSAPRGEGARLEFQLVDELADRGGRLVEGGLLVLLQLDLDDLLDPVASELDRHPDVEALGAVLPVQVRGAGQDLLLVLADRLHHLHRGGGRRVVGAARLEEGHDL